MSDVKSINNHHPKSLLVELLRLLCRPLDGPDDSNGYLDVHLVCRDGVVGVRTQISQIDVIINLRILCVIRSKALYYRFDSTISF